MHKLCYVDMPWCYFTNKPVEEQKMECWHEVPYENYAMEPYNDEPGQILKIALDLNVQPYPLSRNISVYEINIGLMPWFYFDILNIKVYAGTSLEDFKALIEKAGGKIYYYIPEAITVRFGEELPNMMELKKGASIVCE